MQAETFGVVFLWTLLSWRVPPPFSFLAEAKISLLVIDISNAKIFAVFESSVYQIVATGKLSGE
jgi:hypothetical protein